MTSEVLADFRNQGGFDLLGRTKDQIRSLQQVNDAKAACQALRLDGLVLVGGCGTNTDAAQLAETFAASGCDTKVIGVPVTIDGDLKNQFVETDVGFDTTCKVYSQLISNICTDALSAEKVLWRGSYLQSTCFVWVILSLRAVFSFRWQNFTLGDPKKIQCKGYKGVFGEKRANLTIY
jgi:hypothetical protein